MYGSIGLFDVVRLIRGNWKTRASIPIRQSMRHGGPPLATARQSGRRHAAGCAPRAIESVRVRMTQCTPCVASARQAPASVQARSATHPQGEQYSRDRDACCRSVHQHHVSERTAPARAPCRHDAKVPCAKQRAPRERDRRSKKALANGAGAWDCKALQRVRREI